MSVVVRNGKVAMEAKPKGLDAPTPSQIAERAYDLAISIALEAGHDDLAIIERLGQHAAESKQRVLASLRESVINPGAIPWWRK